MVHRQNIFIYSIKYEKVAEENENSYLQPNNQDKTQKRRHKLDLQ